MTPTGAEAKSGMSRGGLGRARRGNTSAGSWVRTERDDEQVFCIGEFAVTQSGGSKLGGQGENRTHLEKLCGFTVRNSPTERPAPIGHDRRSFSGLRGFTASNRLRAARAKQTRD